MYEDCCCQGHKTVLFTVTGSQSRMCVSLIEGAAEVVVVVVVVVVYIFRALDVTNFCLLSLSLSHSLPSLSSLHCLALATQHWSSVQQQQLKSSCSYTVGRRRASLKKIPLVISTQFKRRRQLKQNCRSQTDGQADNLIALFCMSSLEEMEHCIIPW